MLPPLIIREKANLKKKKKFTNVLTGKLVNQQIIKEFKNSGFNYPLMAKKSFKPTIVSKLKQNVKTKRSLNK